MWYGYYKLSLRIFQTVQRLTFKVFTIFHVEIQSIMSSTFYFTCKVLTVIDLSDPYFVSMVCFMKPSMNVWEDFSAEALRLRNRSMYNRLVLSSRSMSIITTFHKDSLQSQSYLTLTNATETGDMYSNQFHLYF